jgi:hypothetical protein
MLPRVQADSISFHLQRTKPDDYAAFNLIRYCYTVLETKGANAKNSQRARHTSTVSQQRQPHRLRPEARITE